MTAIMPIPVSVRSSLDVLNNAEERKVAILGDMFELGADEKKLHYQLGEYFKEKQIDMAVLAGELSENTYQGIRDSGAATQVYYYKTLEIFSTIWILWFRRRMSFW